MQNSDYRCLAQIFKAVPLRGDDVYVDVGCGEGRTLTYHASRHFCGKEYGVELDPAFAEIAARRTKRYGNVEIVCGNVLEQEKVVKEGTAFFLYNPFGREVLVQFLDMIEREHGSGVPENMPEAGSDDRCVRLYYFCYYFRSELDERENWHIIWRGMTVRRPFRDLPVTIYEYRLLFLGSHSH
ncbi:MAG: methyltransferase domain-containing protein [Lachnospiraceae bacterium]|nr:methyltransferase domain-containing protein [Lachnospiraceae bacterium]